MRLDELQNTPAGRRPDNAHLFESKEQPKKRQKFGNKKIEWEGLLFDSTKEYKRYRELLLQVKLEIIEDLERQIDYELIPANDKEKATVYRCDHRYRIVKTRELIIEDVKSTATRKLPDYVMKRKLMLAVHGIEVQEV